MSWTLKAHPRFERDLKKLSKADKEQLAEIIVRLKEDPYRFKSLKGCTECFRVRFSNLRLIYALKGNMLWLIIIDKRKRVYKEMRKRI
jgi:mRNA-degrading endonuclease RelE of RelBE toxin-antitoxin system